MTAKRRPPVGAAGEVWVCFARIIKRWSHGAAQFQRLKRRSPAAPSARRAVGAHSLANQLPPGHNQALHQPLAQQDVGGAIVLAQV